MTISIRRSTDIEQLRALDKELMGRDVSFPRPENHIWWLAFVDGEVAGYAALGLYETEGRYGFLARAAVVPKFRGRGIQRRLIRVREIAARRLGYRALLTYTAKWNTASANNLIASGFRLYNPAYKYGIANALYFHKDLAS